MLKSLTDKIAKVKLSVEITPQLAYSEGATH